MTTATIRLGTRASRLAVSQSTIVGNALRARGERVEIVEITTSGDVRAPDTTWGEGAFVDALETALRAGSIDAAVHSAKDMPIPGAADADLVVAAYPERADPRDVLVTRDGRGTLAGLPAGTVIGTDSPRRTGFVLAARPDLRVIPLHGNVDTRVRRLDDGEVDGLILAGAGLTRLGLANRIAQYLDPGVVPPAPGQGALAVQVRAGDTRALAAVGAIDDAAVRRAVETERAVLAAAGGGCRSAVGALATVAEADVFLVAGSTTPDGATIHRGRAAAEAAADLGHEIGARLGNGLPGNSAARVLVTRAVRQVAELVGALARHGIVGLPVSTIEIEPVAPDGELDAAARRLSTYDWVVVTSSNAARAILSAAERVGAAPGSPRWAVVGFGTRRALEANGIEVTHVPSAASAQVLAAELPVRPGERVLLPRGDRADASLPDALRQRGAVVHDVVVYRTRLADAAARQLLREALRGGVDAAIFTSGSTVQGLVRLADDLPRPDAAAALAIPAICIGHGAAMEAARAGLLILIETGPAAPADIAASVADALETLVQKGESRW